MTADRQGDMDRLKERKVLVVEDDPGVLKSLTALLQRGQLDVEAFGDGAAALARIREEGVLADFVLTDLNLGKTNGLQILEAVREKSPTTPVIVLTGEGTIESAVDAMKRGAYFYVQKPFEPQALFHLLVRAARELDLTREVERLREVENLDNACGGMLGRTAVMKTIFRMVDKVARSTAAVLIAGESGTGKELLARAIHERSDRSRGPFLAVNLSAIPETLLDGELFGARKGSYTGSDRDRPGFFRSAGGGTLFLDEIAELDESLQVKLLRVLQEQEVTPLGESHPVRVDVRVLSATNRNIEEAIRAGKFREDLYYRLNVVKMEIPPLRDRRGDIAMLADHFLRLYSGDLPSGPYSLSEESLRALESHPWPGNVRELENVLQRAALVCESVEITLDDLMFQRADEGNGASLSSTLLDLPYEDAKRQAIDRFQHEYFQNILDRNSGNISASARECGITRAALQRIIKRLELQT